jgi:hypothetical protein
VGFEQQSQITLVSGVITLPPARQPTAKSSSGSPCIET